MYGHFRAFSYGTHLNYLMLNGFSLIQNDTEIKLCEEIKLTRLVFRFKVLRSLKYIKN